MLRQAATAASEPVPLPGLADPLQGQGRFPAGPESVVRRVETGLATGLPVGFQIMSPSALHTQLRTTLSNNILNIGGCKNCRIKR